MVTANWPELDLRACEEAQMNELFKFAEQMVSNVNYRFEKTVVTTRGGGGGDGKIISKIPKWPLKFQAPGVKEYVLPLKILFGEVVIK